MFLASILLFSGGCHRDTEPGRAGTVGVPPAASSASVAPPREAGDGGIAWDLTAEPSTAFPMAKRGDFKLWIVARNDAPAVADTERDALRYEVNGSESTMLEMAFGNGGRDRRWYALPPTQTLREARGGSTDPTFGESLFPHPGDYRLTLRREGRVVATLDVRVSP
jgi:hypothetical protein